MTFAAATARPGVSGRFVSTDAKHWLPQALLVLATLALCAAHQGALLTLAFPALSTAVGLWLYFKSPARYVGFVWIAFTAPACSDSASDGACSGSTPIIFTEGLSAFTAAPTPAISPARHRHPGTI